MSKKFKKSAKEIERLQNLYQLDSDKPKESVNVVNKTAFNSSQSDNASLISNQQTVKHMAIKQDLIFLSVLIIVMMALLFGLNYLAATTSFGNWLASLVGHLF